MLPYTLQVLQAGLQSMQKSVKSLRSYGEKCSSELKRGKTSALLYRLEASQAADGSNQTLRRGLDVRDP